MNGPKVDHRRTRQQQPIRRSFFNSSCKLSKKPSHKVQPANSQKHRCLFINFVTLRKFFLELSSNYLRCAFLKKKSFFTLRRLKLVEGNLQRNDFADVQNDVISALSWLANCKRSVIQLPATLFSHRGVKFQR